MIDFDFLVGGVMLWLMRISNAGVDYVLAHDFFKGFVLLPMDIVVSDMCSYTILTDCSPQFLTPLAIC